MTKDYEEMSVAEQIRSGLADSIAYSRGELSLKTTTRPAPPPAVRPREVRALRNSLRMSQAVFAATLNVSTKSVQSWEQGVREPSDAALRVLQIVRAHPDVVRSLLVAPNARTTGGRRRKTGNARRMMSGRGARRAG